MHLAVIIVFMLVLPCISIVLDAMLGPGPTGLAYLIGKWFVFWGVGARLGLAGFRQVTRPAFTAEHIFGIRNTEAHVLVQELGFANVAFGCAGLASLFNREWIPPIAIAGMVFYALAGALHVRNKNRNRHETHAMISDLWIAAVLALYLAAR